VRKLLVVAVLVPAVYVASVVIYFPAVVWHRFERPAASALMDLRRAEALAAGREWKPRYEWVPLSRISPELQRAVLTGEDTRFYEHAGFDFEQIRRAWKRNRRTDELRGASTITQQTVKNLYLSPSRNVLRKAREVLLTVWMEAWLPKDRILELYLNIVELGPGIFGAEAASRAYFGRPASRLTRDQAALLAATLPAPLARNPAHSSRGLRHRQALIQSRMSRWYGGRAGLATEPVAEPDTGRAPPPEEVPAEPLSLPEPEPAGVESTADSIP